jgi:hypothetical protein
MDATYNGLALKMPGWIAYFDVVYRVLGEEVLLVDFEMSGLSIVKDEDEAPVGVEFATNKVHSDLHNLFESSFEQGEFDDLLIESAKQWGYND